MAGTLYFGDNLDVLREHIADDSVDLIYLDPPFNSSASYNVLFKAPDGKGSQSQIMAFEDTWHWNESSEIAFDEVMQSGRSNVASVLRAMRQFLGENDVMAYIAMMATSRLLKKARDGFEDGLVAEVVFELDLEGAVELKFGRAGAGDLVHLVEACPGKADLVGSVVDVEAGLHGPEGDLAVAIGRTTKLAGLQRSR